MRRQLILTLFTVTTLTACGGGGGDSGTPAAQVAPTQSDDAPPVAAPEPARDEPDATPEPIVPAAPEETPPGPAPTPSPEPETAPAPAPEPAPSPAVEGSPPETEPESTPLTPAPVEEPVEQEVPSVPDPAPESEPAPAPPAVSVEIEEPETPEPAESQPVVADPEVDELSLEQSVDIVSEWMQKIGADFILGLNVRYMAGTPEFRDSICVYDLQYAENPPVTSIVCNDAPAESDDGLALIHVATAFDTDECRAGLINGTFDQCNIESVVVTEFVPTGIELSWFVVNGSQFVSLSTGGAGRCEFDTLSYVADCSGGAGAPEGVLLMMEHALIISGR